MYITLTGKTNKEYVRVNLCYFKLPSGTIVGIDRLDTDYSIYDGEFNVVFDDCYLWTIDGECPFVSEHLIDNSSFLDGAHFVSVELEDDVDDDYIFEVETVDWGD